MQREIKINRDTEFSILVWIVIIGGFATNNWIPLIFVSLIGLIIYKK